MTALSMETPHVGPGAKVLLSALLFQKYEGSAVSHNRSGEVPGWVLPFCSAVSCSLFSFCWQLVYCSLPSYFFSFQEENCIPQISVWLLLTSGAGGGLYKG